MCMGYKEVFPKEKLNQTWIISSINVTQKQIRLFYQPPLAILQIRMQTDGQSRHKW